MTGKFRNKMSKNFKFRPIFQIELFLHRQLVIILSQSPLRHYRGQKKGVGQAVTVGGAETNQEWKLLFVTSNTNIGKTLNYF